MNFDVYCDESGPELLHSEHPKARYMAIGSLWLPEDLRPECKAALHDLRHRHGIGSEFKWRKVSPSKLAFYRDALDWFLERGNDVRFRAIVVDREKIDLVKFHEGDGELGFYKFYYQLLLHWTRECNRYRIFCDHKKNRLPCRLKTLETCLNRANLASEIMVQAIPSHESILIQLSDVLSGLTQARFNDLESMGPAKRALLLHLEDKLGHPVRATSVVEQKFNVFEIQPGGGW
jgi:hypothetical protein